MLLEVDGFELRLFVGRKLGFVERLFDGLFVINKVVGKFDGASASSGF